MHHVTSLPMSSATALVESLSGTGALQVPQLFNVSGWVAVVTGGGTGLGLVTALALADNGATVYISGRRLEPLEAAAKAFANKTTNGKSDGDKALGRIIPVQADVSTKEGIESEHWSRI
jgi:NADP-dependent 3-hydroxy acid dehydrogenase YdfG